MKGIISFLVARCRGIGICESETNAQEVQLFSWRGSHEVDRSRTGRLRRSRHVVHLVCELAPRKDGKLLFCVFWVGNRTAELDLRAVGIFFDPGVGLLFGHDT